MFIFIYIILSIIFICFISRALSTAADTTAAAAATGMPNVGA
jgi:hypothetical protein